MDRKVIVKQGPASPRGETFEEEDVFDYPGIEDDSNESGPVSREAYLALREAFKSLKKRFLEAQAKISELNAKLKQRDRKGSHEQVYQERDALLSHLHKSYLAFEEKYGENEQLKKMIQELQAQGEGGAQRGPTSEEEGKQEAKKYTTLVEELKTIGLEVIRVEDTNQQVVLLTDRDSLKKWIEEKSDGNITIAIQGRTTEHKATETEAIFTRVEAYEQSEGKRKRVEADVILLKQKIEDQAQELNRFYKIFKEVMVQNKNLRAREQRNEVEGREATEGPQASKPEEGLAKRTTVTLQASGVLQKKTETILSTAQEQVVEMRQVREHLDKQNKSLRTLVDLTEKSTKDFQQLISASKARPVAADSPGYPVGRRTRWPEEGEIHFTQGQRIVEVGNFERVIAEDAPLSIPVQESELLRLRIQDEAGGAGFSQRLSGERFPAPTSRGAEGRAVSMTTFLSENTGTGESDIEVIEEEDFIGATPSRGKICPMCERFFPESYDQREFENHVEQHFGDDS